MNRIRGRRAQGAEWKSEAVVPLEVGSYCQRMQAILGGVEILMKRALGNHKGVVCSDSTRRGRTSLVPCTLGSVGLMRRESDLALVSLVRTASRWVSGNPTPFLNGPKSIVPLGRRLGRT